MDRVRYVGAKGGGNRRTNWAGEESEGFIATGRKSTIGVSLGTRESQGSVGIWILLMMIQLIKMRRCFAGCATGILHYHGHGIQPTLKSLRRWKQTQNGEMTDRRGWRWFSIMLSFVELRLLFLPFLFSSFSTSPTGWVSPSQTWSYREDTWKASLIICCSLTAAYSCESSLKSLMPMNLSGDFQNLNYIVQKNN